MRRLFFSAMMCICALLYSGCPGGGGSPAGDTQYRVHMRDFVKAISQYGKSRSPGFAVIPQNGQELLTDTGAPDATPDEVYLAALDGIGREDLSYGYTADNIPTPAVIRDDMTALLDVARDRSKAILAIDYCQGEAHVDAARAHCEAHDYLSFAANRRQLDAIPPYPAAPWDVNANGVNTLSQARNYLYLINPAAYSTKDALLAALRATQYDAMVIDLFFDEASLTADDVASLKTKPQGGRRLIIAYMSIGEAEDYRWYWNPTWNVAPPDWLGDENPDWEGNYAVEYWNPDWRAFIMGGPDAYLDRILAAGFDGVYLDMVDSYEYFEARESKEH